MNPIGIMQGRLSLPSNRTRQVFPMDTWREEFEVAAQLGLNTIEWLVEAETLQINPLLSASGRQEIERLARQTGVRVDSVCAHCVLQWQPYDEGGSARLEPLAMIISAAGAAGIKHVIIPVLEAATTRKAKSLNAAVALFKEAMAAAENSQVNLVFELDRTAEDSLEFVQGFGSASAKICYDSGNATADGRNIVTEIEQLLPVVAEIHLKDRRVGGGSMPLGQGDTPFTDFFKTLNANHWRGPFVMETPVRDNPIEQARQNLAFVRKNWI